jgi:hypothetical protein
VPTPQNPSDAANKGYVDATEGNLLASPAAIGSVAPNAATFTAVNKVINPLTYSGSDIGAQINAAIAANNCWYGQNICLVQLPTGVYTYSTTITIPFGVTLQCGGQTTHFIHASLNYTGTGAAVSRSGQFRAIDDGRLNLLQWRRRLHWNDHPRPRKQAGLQQYSGGRICRDRRAVRPRHRCLSQHL